MQYLVLDPPQPDYDAMTFDYDKDTALVARWSKLADAKNADLSKFRKSGGKLIMTYGWADQILQPMMGVNYYERSWPSNGTSTTDFARLFMVPGMAHCGGGVGPDRNDAVTRRDRLGGEGQGAGLAAGQQGHERGGRPHAPAVPVSAGGALQGSGQHRRRGELQLRCSLSRDPGLGTRDPRDSQSSMFSNPEPRNPDPEVTASA